MWLYDKSYKVISFKPSEFFTHRDAAPYNYIIICWPLSSVRCSRAPQLL